MPKTIPDFLLRIVERHPDLPSIHFKEGKNFTGISFKDLLSRIEAISAGLIDLGVGFQDKVGLFADSRPEWLLVNFAIQFAGATDVPRGGDSTPEELAYIINHSELSVAVVENLRVLEKIEKVRDRIPGLKTLIIIDPEGVATKKENLIAIKQLEATGEKRLKKEPDLIRKRIADLGPDHMSALIYTSGTTGEPKGVVLTHSNFAHQIRVLPPLIGFGPGDRWLSLLPPWHIFERTVQVAITCAGCSIAFTNPRNLIDDLAAFHPTYMTGVPRVWQGIYDKVCQKMSQEGRVKATLFSLLVRASTAYVSAQKVIYGQDPVFIDEPRRTRIGKVTKALITMILLSPVYRLAYKKFAVMRDRFGGTLKAPVSGGGALPRHVDQFFAAVGLEVLEGYGLTETAPVLAARCEGHKVIGTVGPPIPDTEIMIADESGNPLPPGHKGIVMVRGPQIMAGYYKRPEDTAKVILEDGWFNTGDLGMLTVRGELAITGRAKDTIVLLGGENVEPGPIEETLTQSPYITQVMVVGQDQKFLGALVVPDMEAIREFAHHHRLPDHDPSALVKDRAIQDLIDREIKGRVCSETGFKPFERVVRFALLADEFRPGHEMTHTLKIRRHVVTKKYHHLIEAMFE